MNRRSMGGRIYQEQTFRPKLISLNNPEQRKIHYPIKGDTSFQPEVGRKHYMSPKHSAIHSIIFNEDYAALIQEKSNLLRRLNQSTQRLPQKSIPYDQKQHKFKITNLNTYLNDGVIQEIKRGNHTSLFPPYNNFNAYQNNLSQSRDHIKKGHLYRQGSMNDVLKPYESLQNMGKSTVNKNLADTSSNYNFLSRNQSFSYGDQRNLNKSSLNGNKSGLIDRNMIQQKYQIKSDKPTAGYRKQDQIFAGDMSYNFSRQKNPNYLNSIF